jgi:hypothetical protein
MTLGTGDNQTAGQRIGALASIQMRGTVAAGSDLAAIVPRHDADLVDFDVRDVHIRVPDQKLASLVASAGVSTQELEALPQPRAIRDAEKGLAATRRWHTLATAQGKSRPAAAGPRR